MALDDLPIPENLVGFVAFSALAGVVDLGYKAIGTGIAFGVEVGKASVPTSLRVGLTTLKVAIDSVTGFGIASST